MRNLVLLAFLLALFTAGACDVFAAEGNGSQAEAMLNLLQKKGIISQQEVDSLRHEGKTDLKEMVNLLRGKGILNQEESAALLKGESSSEAAPQAAIKKPAPQPIRLSSATKDMLRAKLHLIFYKQGLIDGEEEEQIAERLDRTWTPGDEDDIIADPDFEIEYHKTTLPKEGLLADIDALVAIGLLAPDEADRVKTRLLKKLSLERLTDDMGKELRAELDRQVGERIVPIPDWTTRIKFSGDFRLRYEGDFFDGPATGGGFDTGNGIFVKPDNPTQILNSAIDRHQLRIRARLAALAKVNDQVEVGIGLATGTTTNPVSTNATLGDSLNKKNFLLDLGYLKWTPAPGLTFWGGRFPNPWFGSDLVWDPDINFDGLALSYRRDLTPNLGLTFTTGAFPIQEIELSSHDKWLYAGQLGLQYRRDKDFVGTLAGAVYAFDNMHGVANDPSRPGANDWSAPLFQQKGNTLFDIDPSSTIKTAYAADFTELNLYGSLDLGFWDPIRVVFVGDYVNNVGYDGAKVNQRTGAMVKKETEGFEAGMSVGYPETRELGLWKLYGYYKYLEADAVVDAFAESDFHLGGTNCKGWVVGADVGIAKNFWLSTRWLSSNEISGPPLAVDVFQLNLNAKF